MLPVRKAAKESIQDVDKGKRRAIVAFATYGSIDRDGDRANKGMFTKSWNEFKDVRLFENHDKTKAPGRIDKLWEDTDHAYASVIMGTHTLGEDTLKQMDEGIITDSSYYFLPTKWSKIGKGYNYTEGFHKEVSVLTHWGAHPESKIVSVQKSLQAFGEGVEKQLNDTEVSFLRQFIGSVNNQLRELVLFSTSLSETSDIYTWTNSVIGDISYTISRFKDRLVYGQKEWNDEELKGRLTKLKSFCNNSTATDETIQNVLKEAEEIESILMLNSTSAAVEQTKAALKQHSDTANSSQRKITLLNLNMLLNEKNV